MVARGLAAVVLVGLLAGGTRAEDAERTWDAKAELSYVKTGGNTDTESLAGKLEGGTELGAYRLQGNATALQNSTDGEKTADRYFIEGRGDRLLTDRLSVFLGVDYLRDPFAGYDSRFTVGPGVGYDVLVGGPHNLAARASFQWAHDNFVGNGTDSYVSGKLVGDYSWQVRDGLKFTQLVDYAISFEDTGVYFVNSESRLEAGLVGHLSLATSYVVNFQADPPADAQKTDTTFLTSLVFSF